jgi:hypothetical protein
MLRYCSVGLTLLALFFASPSASAAEKDDKIPDELRAMLKIPG